VTRELICNVLKKHAALVFKGWKSGIPQPLKMKEACSFEILGICNLLVSVTMQKTWIIFCSSSIHF